MLHEKKKIQKRKEKTIMDVNAIMLKNKKKKKGTSSTTLSKMIIEISLPQEGDANKLVVVSSVVNKVVEVDIGEDHSLSTVDTK